MNFQYQTPHQYSQSMSTGWGSTWVPVKPPAVEYIYPTANIRVTISIEKNTEVGYGLQRNEEAAQQNLAIDVIDDAVMFGQLDATLFSYMSIRQLRKLNFFINEMYLTKE